MERINLTIPADERIFPDIYGWIQFDVNQLYDEVEEDIKYNCTFEGDIDDIMNDIDLNQDEYTRQVQQLILDQFNLKAFNAKLSKDSDSNYMYIDVDFTFEEFCKKILEFREFDYLTDEWESAVLSLIVQDGEYESFSNDDLYENYPRGCFNKEFVNNLEEVTEEYKIKWK